MLIGEDEDEVIWMTGMNGHSTVPTLGQKDNNSGTNVSINIFYRKIKYLFGQRIRSKQFTYLLQLHYS